MTTISNDKNLCSIVHEMSSVNRNISNCSNLCKNVSSGDQLTAVCYTPKNATGTVSLVKAFSHQKRTVTTDANLITIPSNAIIDQIDFFGINNFTTKGTFSIGLGQLNDAIMMPLIESSDSTIALDKSGGCRQFLSTSLNGKNAKTLVLFPSNINIVLEHPITTGSLQVLIKYRMKPGVE